MKLGELRPAVEKKDRKRLGRGIGSGNGKTAGKGHKEKMQEVVEELEEASKEVKHHYIEDYQKEDLQIEILRTIQK